MKIREMFSKISGRYDLLNHILSLNLDRRWRRILIDSLPGSSRIILDSGCGTGDLGINIIRHGKSVIFTDFSHEMLLETRRKLLQQNPAMRSSKRAMNGDIAKCENSAESGDNVRIIEADLLALPLRNGFVDAIVSAFTIRNLESMETGFSEMVRILEPGGCALILEFSRPKSVFVRIFYYPYLKFLVPFIGTLVSGNRKAYSYLSSTISSFPLREAIVGMMKAAGFERLSFRTLSWGIVTLYSAFKPCARGGSFSPG